MPKRTDPTLARRVRDYCRVRLPAVLAPRDIEAIEIYLVGLAHVAVRPPQRNRNFDWTEIAAQSGVNLQSLRDAADALIPLLAAMVRQTPDVSATQPQRAHTEEHRSQGKAQDGKIPSASSPKKPRGRPRKVMEPRPTAAAPLKRPRGRPRKAPSIISQMEVVEFPEPLYANWEEPETFAEALGLHMKRHGDNLAVLHQAVVQPHEEMNLTTLASWRRGVKAPRSIESLEILRRIEHRYRLPPGYFKAKLPHSSRSSVGRSVTNIGAAERRRIAWHLPDDFDLRPLAEREKILEWVRTVVVSGATDYRRYQAAAMKHRFAIRFPGIGVAASSLQADLYDDGDDEDPDIGLKEVELCGAVDAPPRLAAEMQALVRFKTATLTQVGLQRNGVWGEETAAQKVEHLGLMLGSLAAAPRGAVRGYGVSVTHLSLGMLIFPAVWDWYIQWRERRRGFYTAWETDLLSVGAALARKETGWMRQTPALAAALRPVTGLISQAEIDVVKADWDGACDVVYKHALARAKEVQRVSRVHRDPFEPIMPVLEADSPLREYRKITEEIIRLMPDERLYPKAAAEAVRSFLMLRLGLHLGLRQKNLRQLLLCAPGRLPTPERGLEELKRGEMRWSERDQGWEVVIPSVAFKNASSSFFGSKPFRLVLPDLADLYKYIDSYVSRHRRRLLLSAEDPGTFFVKSAKRSSSDAAYDQAKFYEAWRWTIQRYGIFNPYTGRGAIKGLLPHGPHNVRDVLATHILKQTGSYEQASYAIQDTPEMVSKHYGRFLPQDKAALAAQILNKVWDAA